MPEPREAPWNSVSTTAPKPNDTAVSAVRYAMPLATGLSVAVMTMAAMIGTGLIAMATATGRICSRRCPIGARPAEAF